MNIVTLDFETFWSATHSLTKMSAIAYVMHPDTEIISCSIKVNDGKTTVHFGEHAIRDAFKTIDWSEALAVAHNMSGFDAMILAWRFGIKPRMWGCTLSMARPIHAKDAGGSLAALVKYYGLGVKDSTALVQTKGKRLAEFTGAEMAAMTQYNADDTDQCKALFDVLKPHFSAAEMWHIDATIRMLVEPQFEVDREMLLKALADERKSKQRSVLLLARHLVKEGFALPPDLSIDSVEGFVTDTLASAPKFSALLESVGAEVPTKPSPTDPMRTIPALAKTDQGLLDLLEHDNIIVAAAARARLSVKSTLLETRIEKFLAASEAAGGYLPVPQKYCGADTTGRWSGWEYNPQNLPRIPRDKEGNIIPKPSNALRMCLRAPEGHVVGVADLSGIELRVNHFLWKVPSTMALYAADPVADLYRAAGAIVHGCPPEQVTKDQRQVEKVKALGLGFGAGAATFQKVAKIMGGLNITEDQSYDWVQEWRSTYPEIVRGWQTCHDALTSIASGEEVTVDPWGLCRTSKAGIHLPSGRVIRYPGLHQETAEGKREWWYGEGRNRARIYAGKVTENIVQALARDVIADSALAFFLRTGYRPALSVHDELVYVFPEDRAAGLLDILQEIMRTPPKWWPELIVWSEGDIAPSYGEAK